MHTMPYLGPIAPGERPLLDLSMTHLTSGLGWPAVDTGWDVGEPVFAPEPCIVDDDTSSSAGGDAFYVKGLESGCRHWVAHITTVPRLGTRFERGAVMTTISGDHERPHVHWAMEATPLLGHRLLYGETGNGPNYTFGAPTIREQLMAALGHETPTPEDKMPEWVPSFVRWYMLDRRAETRPEGVPAEIPTEVWKLIDAVGDVHLALGPPDPYQDWRTWRLLGSVGPRPANAPTTIPKRWWPSATEDHVFASRFSEAATAATREANASLLARIAVLEEELASEGADDVARDARLLALVEQMRGELQA